MAGDILNEWKENALLLVNNPQALFEKAKSMDLGKAVVLALVSYVISGAIQGLPTGILGTVWSIILTPIFALIGIVIMGVIFHILLKLGGGKGSFENTLNVLLLVSPLAIISGVLSMITSLINSWVVTLVLGLAMMGVGLWGIYLHVRGFSIVHEMRMGRVALFAVVIPLIVLVVLVAILVVVILAAFGSLVSDMPLQAALLGLGG